MTSRTSVWTPRRTHKLWPLGPGDKFSDRKLSFKPQVHSEWHMPPKPSWGKKKLATATEHAFTDEELRARAEELRREAESLTGNAPPPSLSIQLGNILVQLDAKAYESMLKKWDQKGRGEFMKAEMRLNLRNAGLTVTSAESDALFDTWDEDGGGSLDLSELKHALSKTMKEAKEFNSKPDPAQQQIQRLQKRARMADEAADSVEKADSLERELEEFSKQLESRADVRLGALLQKRNIKPGEFVVRFSKSQGASAGELSKADFRKAVLLLFEGKQGGGGGSASQGSSPRKEGEASTSPSEINAVFDQYDDDGGGSMDVDEAKTMIKGLQAAGRDAEQEKRAKEREAKAQRAKAIKKAAQAMAPQAEDGSFSSPPASPTGKSTSESPSLTNPMEA